MTIHLSEEDIFRRSTAIHCDISQVEGCIVLDICNFKQLIKQYSEEKIASLKRDFYELVQSELSALGDRSICCVLSDKVVILHIQTPKQTILQVARSLQRVLKRKILRFPPELDIAVKVCGISKPATKPQDWRCKLQPLVLRPLPVWTARSFPPI